MANVKAVEFAGVGSIPHLVIEQNGKYEYVPIRTGVTNISNIKQGEKAKIVKEWTKKAAGIGRKITINTSSGKISGIAQGIDADGALKIKTKKKIERVLVGDVDLS